MHNSMIEIGCSSYVVIQVMHRTLTPITIHERVLCVAASDHIAGISYHSAIVGQTYMYIYNS